jgi:hypothetical protein
MMITVTLISWAGLALIVFCLLGLISIVFFHGRRWLGAAMLAAVSAMIVGVVCCMWLFAYRATRWDRVVAQHEIISEYPIRPAGIHGHSLHVPPVQAPTTVAYHPVEAPTVTAQEPVDRTPAVSTDDVRAATAEIENSQRIDELQTTQPAGPAAADATATPQVEPAATVADEPQPSSEPTDSAVATAEAAPAPPTPPAPPATEAASPVTASPGTPAAATASPDERPEWVQNPPKQVDGHLALVIVSDPFDNRFDCDRQLNERTREALQRYAQEYCRSVDMPGEVVIRVLTDEIQSVTRDRYYALRPTSLGDMNQAYQLTVFDTAIQGKLAQRMAETVVDRRLQLAGTVSGGVLAVVSLLYGASRFAARKAADPFAA